MQVENMQPKELLWCGVAPDEWKKNKLFRLSATISSGGTPPSGQSEYYGGEITWVQTGDLNDDYISETAKTLTSEGLANSSAKIFPKGSILMAMYGATIGKLGILDIDAATNQACCVISPTHELHHKFLFYLLLAMRQHFISQSYGGGQPNISQEIVKQEYIFYPIVEEQRRIAAFLDQQCAAIDGAIAVKQQQLETFEQIRRSVIYRAVTKGLDDTAIMQETHIDWIGKVPAHWQASRIKNVAELSPRLSGEKPSANEEYAVVPMEDVSDDGQISVKQIKSFNDISSGLTYFKNGDVIFAKITPCMENGKGAFITSLPTRYAFGSTEFHVLRPNRVNGEFLYYYTYNTSFRDYAEVNMVGAAGQKRVSSTFLKTTPIYLPPIEEQARIVPNSTKSSKHGQWSAVRWRCWQSTRSR